MKEQAIKWERNCLLFSNLCDNIVLTKSKQHSCAQLVQQANAYSLKEKAVGAQVWLCQTCKITK